MTEDTVPTYEVLALRFGTQAKRLTRQNFLFDDGNHAADDVSPFDFYLWVIRNDRNLLVVDTGFSPAAAARRGREILHPPKDGLADLRIAPGDVADLVITHMHWDHAGNLDLFPSARVHLQEKELAFCTARAMRHEAARRPFEPDDVGDAVRLLFDERLVLHDGPAEILPGVTIHPAVGHTPGLQVVRVHTKRGWIVLASDSTHLWANIRQRSPFPILDHLSSMMESYEIVEGLADGEDHVIPGHDPQVALRFPQEPTAPHWVCLHEPPLADVPYIPPLEGVSG